MLCVFLDNLGSDSLRRLFMSQSIIYCRLDKDSIPLILIDHYIKDMIFQKFLTKLFCRLKLHKKGSRYIFFLYFRKLL